MNDENKLTDIPDTQLLPLEQNLMLVEGSALGPAPKLGILSQFVHDQPVLTLSLAFGLGLIVTSMLARRQS